MICRFDPQPNIQTWRDFGPQQFLCTVQHVVNQFLWKGLRGAKKGKVDKDSSWGLAIGTSEENQVAELVGNDVCAAMAEAAVERDCPVLLTFH